MESTETSYHCRRTKEKCGDNVQDPVEVFCRLLPACDDPCFLTVVNGNSVSLRLTEDKSSHSSCEEMRDTRYTFKEVFREKVPLRNIFGKVALPLVQDVVSGLDRLLIICGTSSSDTTSVIFGSPDDCGILPRCLDIIFNSIYSDRTREHVLTTNNAHGSHCEAATTVQSASVNYNQTDLSLLPGKELPNTDWTQRIADGRKLPTPNTDHKYSVYISCFKIKNDRIYDLFEEAKPSDGKRDESFDQKVVERALRNYVADVVVVEALSADEAFRRYCNVKELFQAMEDSATQGCDESHVVFNIIVTRVVSMVTKHTKVTPTELRIFTGQLSLVDLAGCKDEYGTKLEDGSLKLSENEISLIALRTCINALRETRRLGSNYPVPDQKFKLMQLFQNFLDGKDKMSILLCIRPCCHNYERIMNVMKFAEAEQGPMIARISPTPSGISQYSKTCDSVSIDNLGNESKEVFSGEVLKTQATLDKISRNKANHRQQHAGDFAAAGTVVGTDENAISDLMEIVAIKRNRKTKLIDNYFRKRDDFQQKLLLTLTENLSLKERNTILKMDLNASSQQVKSLETELSSSARIEAILNRKLAIFRNKLKNLEAKLIEKEEVIRRNLREQERLRQSMIGMMGAEKENILRRVGAKLAAMENETLDIAEKLKLISKSALGKDEPESSESFSNTETKKETRKRKLEVDAVESKPAVSGYDTGDVESSTSLTIPKEIFTEPAGDCSNHKKKFMRSKEVLTKSDSFINKNGTGTSNYAVRLTKSKLDLQKSTSFGKEYCTCEVGDDLYQQNCQNIATQTSKYGLDKSCSVQHGLAPEICLNTEAEGNYDAVSSTKSVATSTTSLKDYSPTKPSNDVLTDNRRCQKRRVTVDEMWLVHRPAGSIELGTVLQPGMPKQKAVTKLKAKYVTKIATRYVLTHHEQNSDGGVETMFFKADIVPTSAGGAQVIFTDVEKLKQESPPLPRRCKGEKQGGSVDPLTLGQVEQNCTFALECHGKPTRMSSKRRKTSRIRSFIRKRCASKNNAAVV